MRSDGTTIGTNNQSSIRGTTITADQGISTKNGTGEPGFIEFYSTNDTNNIKVVAPTVTTNSTLTLPDTGDGDLISTADTETVSTQMLSIQWSHRLVLMEQQVLFLKFKWIIRVELHQYKS